MSQVLDNAYALLIGVGGDDIPETVKDATDIRDVLIDPKFAGYKPENVLLLTNDQASREGILGAMDKVAEMSNESSSCFLFYSGHGGYYPDEDQYYFQPSNFDVDRYSETWVKSEEMKEKVANIPAKNLVFLLDCCHAAGVSKNAQIIGQEKVIDKPKKADGLARAVDRGDGGMTVISSSSKEQLSWILEGDSNSLFTRCLLEVLKGEHKTILEDEFIRITDVADYVNEKVKERKPVQTPFVNMQFFDNIVLSRVSQERMAEVDVAKRSAVITPTSSIISELRELIGKAKTGKAIKSLVKHADQTDNDDLKNKAAMFSGEWNALEDDEMMGIISRSELTRSKNGIRARLLRLIDDLEEELEG